MAKDGRKLELYEILAAKRAKGKIPLGLDATAKQTNPPEQEMPDVTDAPGVIIDDALGGAYRGSPEPERAEEEETAETGRDLI